MSVFINGKKISSAYKGGQQIIGRSEPPCYGTLTCLGDDGTEYNIIVDQLSDYEKLFRNINYTESSITFSFGEVLVANIKGWTFNTSEGTSYVTQTLNDSFLRNFSNLTYPVIIPSWVKTIGSNFMDECINFNSTVTLPEGLESIGTNFMHKCYSVSSLVNIPSTVNELNTYVFKDYNDNIFSINAKEYEYNVKILNKFIYSSSESLMSFSNCTFNFPLIENITDSFYDYYGDIHNNPTNTKITFNNITFGPNLTNVRKLFNGIILENCNVNFSNLNYNCSIDDLFNRCKIVDLNITFPTNKILSINNLFTYIKCNSLDIKITDNIKINNGILTNVEANLGSIIVVKCYAPIANIKYNENNFTSNYETKFTDNGPVKIPHVTYHFKGPYAAEWKTAYNDKENRKIIVLDN